MIIHNKFNVQFQTLTNAVQAVHRVNISVKMFVAVTPVDVTTVTQNLAIIVNCDNARLVENASNTDM